MISGFCASDAWPALLRLIARIIAKTPNQNIVLRIIANETIPPSSDGNRGESKSQLDAKSPGHKQITAKKKTPSTWTMLGTLSGSNMTAAPMI